MCSKVMEENFASDDVRIGRGRNSSTQRDGGIESLGRFVGAISGKYPISYPLF